MDNRTSSVFIILLTEVMVFSIPHSTEPRLFDANTHLSFLSVLTLCTRVWCVCMDCVYMMYTYKTAPQQHAFRKDSCVCVFSLFFFFCSRTFFIREMVQFSYMNYRYKKKAFSSLPTTTATNPPVLLYPLAYHDTWVYGTECNGVCFKQSFMIWTRLITSRCWKQKKYNGKLSLG